MKLSIICGKQNTFSNLLSMKMYVPLFIFLEHKYKSISKKKNVYFSAFDHYAQINIVLK